MAFGLQVWNSSSVKTLDVTDSITRYIDTFDIGTGSQTGSATYSSLSTGRPWITYFRLPSNSGTQYQVPYVYASGTTINWDFGSVSASSRATTRVIFGVY